MTFVESSVEGPVGRATLNRPPLNILNIEMLTEFAGAVRRLAAREEVRVLLLRGQGKAFSAGVDVGEHLPESIDRMLAAFDEALVAVMDCRVPVVAAVHGPCLGGGMELALAADLLYASRDATFAQPEIKLGVFPPFAASAYPQWFGRARASELVLLGETVPAETARAWGIVSDVVDVAGLDDRATDACRRLAALSPSSLRITRKALRLGVRGGLDAFRDIQSLYRGELMATPDAREGLEAFLAKRKPVWKGG